LIDGTAPRIVQKLEAGQYFGRRRPEDGKIDWTRSAREIHDLVRAVAPPFPGAFAQVDGQRWMIHKTRVEPRTIEPSERARLFGADGRCYVACREGGVLQLLAATNAAGPIALQTLARELQQHPIGLS
jgi:methionyl-tRNA formyltransferase